MEEKFDVHLYPRTLNSNLEIIELFNVSVIISSNFLHAVTAEFPDKRVSDNNGSHGLANDRSSRDCANVRAFIGSPELLLCCYIYGG